MSQTFSGLRISDCDTVPRDLDNEEYECRTQQEPLTLPAGRQRNRRKVRLRDQLPQATRETHRTTEDRHA